MIHYYTARERYKPIYTQPEKVEFKLLCTKTWFEETEFVARGPYCARRPKNVTTVRHNVTCPKCLELLIPELEKELNKMKEAHAKNSEAGA
jgi:hypothetical protein